MNELLNRVYNESQEEFYKLLKKKLNSEEKTFIVTANPETFMLSSKDEELNSLLNDKNVILVPDGIAVVKAAKKIGNKITERIAGIDIAEKLLEFSSVMNKKVYLFGSKQEVIDGMKKVINKKYSGIILVGTSNGYVENKDKIMKEIAKLKPDVVLIALGIPAQEKLIYKNINNFKKGIFVGVGGSFDVLSGTKKRAPKLFIKTNTEWLYRIVKEPKRLKRFWNNNIKFMFKIKK